MMQRYERVTTNNNKYYVAYASVYIYIYILLNL